MNMDMISVDNESYVVLKFICNGWLVTFARLSECRIRYA